MTLLCCGPLLHDAYRIDYGLRSPLSENLCNPIRASHIDPCVGILLMKQVKLPVGCKSLPESDLHLMPFSGGMLHQLMPQHPVPAKNENSHFSTSFPPSQ